ncbi:hypothetical protein PORCRE_1779 [Porphyromonas crevioricanis JCM 15906]|uniref:Uncharacterized protein n=1 Tax=Porphyromonas crevioricanis JCM 15906 TaxID=1305617 RepID=T1DTW4_9PORP|nr:hypothetical protein PORCRE_1779 [Porphyromonas crevioricanis JCM 15906]GAD06991.1 hypothetical protein PORCAN_604 [Porphyromonas crevioricanis JCM 13913]
MSVESFFLSPLDLLAGQKVYKIYQLRMSYSCSKSLHE